MRTPAQTQKIAHRAIRCAYAPFAFEFEDTCKQTIGIVKVRLFLSLSLSLSLSLRLSLSLSTHGSRP